MKIFIGGISQETNTFSPSLTGMDLFERGYLLEGMEIRKELWNTNSEISGFYSALEKFPDIEIIQGIAAWAVTSGKVTDGTFEELTTRLIDSLKTTLNIDGVLLFLHGSLVSESMDDCEGYILEKVREVVGNNIPIVSSLDFHACITAKMVDNADMLVGYRTYPHIDLAFTGERAANCLLNLIKGKPKIKKIFQKIPFIPAVENCMTDHEPMLYAMNQLKKLDNNPEVASISLFMPQPWLDTYDTGVSIVLYISELKNMILYENQAKMIIDYIWDNRAELFLKIPGIDDFIKNVGGYEKPVSVVDLGDIVSAGGMGDSTEVLRAFIDNNIKLKTVLNIVDMDTVKKAAVLGEEKYGWFDIGGSSEYGYNKKIRIYAEVVKLSDEVVQAKGESLTGVKLNAGKRALLRHKDNIHIIVSEYSSFNHDPEIVRSMGLNPEDMEVIVQKTHQMFKASYKGIMKSFVYADTQGFTDRNLENLPFKKVKRPIYPLDKDFLIE